MPAARTIIYSLAIRGLAALSDRTETGLPNEGSPYHQGRKSGVLRLDVKIAYYHIEGSSLQRENLNNLNALLTVAQERSFTRAAAKLGTSQSTLSYRIRELETRLGLRLLARTTRSVTPTDAGERLLRVLRPAFEQIDAELAALANLRDRPVGTIRITTTATAAETVLWPKLNTFLRDHPDINIEVSVDPGLTDIVDARFDAGVRLGGQVTKDMTTVRIGPDLRMAVVATPSYFAEMPPPSVPHDLAGHRCINLRLRTQGGLRPWQFGKDGEEVKIRQEGQLVFDDVNLILHAARAGFGIAFIPDHHVQEDIAEGRLVRVLADWCPPFPGYHLYYLSHRQLSPAFTLLVNALRYRGSI